MTVTEPATPGGALQEQQREPRRALLLAGGGLKVAYQAGVLQVWLDEAGVDFHLADGASGGVFSLALWCQGRTGTEIAEAWRQYRPLRAAGLNLRGLARGPFGDSLLSSHRLRRRILPDFGIDWHAVRTSSREATFNVWNLSRQEHVVVPSTQMTADLLVAAVALPMWFPPVLIDGDTWMDAVFATDGNLEETLRRGADELWVIWTVSTLGRWRPGFVGEYFSIIEASANSRLRSVLDRIGANNAERAAGRPGEFGREITVRLIAGDVPLHYLFVWRRTAVARAVDQGVREARAWCADAGRPTVPVPAPASAEAVADEVRFHEVMAGTVAGRGLSGRISVSLDIVVRDTERFVREPTHTAAVSGWVSSPLGELPVQHGTFNLLVQGEGERLMEYDLHAQDAKGRPLRVAGRKRVGRGGERGVWRDTTTLQTTVSRSDTGELLATGALRLALPQFLRQLTTFRSAAPTRLGQARALQRFGLFFLGALWLSYRPPVPPEVAQPTWVRRWSAAQP